MDYTPLRSSASPDLTELLKQSPPIFAHRSGAPFTEVDGLHGPPKVSLEGSEREGFEAMGRVLGSELMTQCCDLLDTLRLKPQYELRNSYPHLD